MSPRKLRYDAAGGCGGGDLVRKSFGANLDVLGDRQVRVRVSTEGVDRVGDVVVQKGLDTANFLKSRTVLWNHDQDHPVAACLSLDNDSAGLVALTQFPEPGISAKADEVHGLLKAGVINAASIGFLPRDVEPVNGRAPSKGLRILTADLMEFSFVSVPANPGAEVLQRALRGRVAGGDGERRKGLYAVSQLAFILHELGFAVDSAVDEAAREGDGSAVPAQLHAALTQLGQALLAMTAEEVGELLDKPGTGFADPEGDIVPIGEAVAILAARGAATKAIKAGRRFSAATAATLRGHLDAIGTAHGAICTMLDEADAPRPDTPASDDDAGMGKRLRLLRLRAPAAGVSA